MCSVYDRFDPARTRHIADLLNRIDLACKVDLVRDEDQFRFWRYSTLESRSYVVNVLRRDGDLDQVELEALAHFPLPQRGQHPRIVLRGCQYLVARLEVESH